ncbi:MAG: FAD-dependent oxidoreductase [Thermoguttaceae bacterium]
MKRQHPRTQRFDRRRFFQATAAATAGLSAAGALAAEPAQPTSDAHTIAEPSRQTPVVEEVDVLVCGAGPAGVAAAIASARSGASTRLVEANGCLGGVWTAGLLSWILDTSNKTGLMRELLQRLQKRGASHAFSGSVAYDVEEMKLFLEEICLEAGVRIRLHTRVCDAVRSPAGRLEAVITDSKSGRQAFRAKAFVDASGDGDLAAQAGCGFDYGNPETGQAQPMSFICLLTGIAPEDVTPFVRELAEAADWGSPKDNLRKAMNKAGVDPSYGKPTLFFLRPGLFCLMANHQYGVSGCNADQLTAASLEGRAEVHRLVNALRATGGAWKDVRIIATPEHIGVREGRRIHGRYTVTAQDLIQGATHPDAVCQVRFPVDVHSTDPTKTKGIADENVRAKPYDVPYRALISKDVDGLLLAGRNISGDFIAHSSYRVTGDSVPMGEAAGAAAALAAKSGRFPHELPWPEIRELRDSVISKEG